MSVVDQLNKIKNDLIEYTGMRMRLYKFEIVEAIAAKWSHILTGVVLFILMIFLLLFIGIATAFYLNDLWNSAYAGFAVVAAFWAVLLIAGIVFRKPIRKQFLQQFLDNNIPS